MRSIIAFICVTISTASHDHRLRGLKTQTQRPTPKGNAADALCSKSLPCQTHLTCCAWDNAAENFGQGHCSEMCTMTMPDMSGLLNDDYYSSGTHDNHLPGNEQDLQGRDESHMSRDDENEETLNDALEMHASDLEVRDKVPSSSSQYICSITVSGVTEASLLASHDLKQSIREGFADAIHLDYSKIQLRKIGKVVLGSNDWPVAARRLQDSTESTDFQQRLKASAGDAGTSAGVGIKNGAESTWESTKNGASIAADGIQQGAVKARAGISALWNKLTDSDLRVEFLLVAETAVAVKSLTKQMDELVASEVQAAIAKKAESMELDLQEVKVTEVSNLVQAGEKDSLHDDEYLKYKLIGPFVAVLFLVFACGLWRWGCCSKKQPRASALSNPHASSSKPVRASNIEKRLDVVAKL